MTEITHAGEPVASAAIAVRPRPARRSALRPAASRHDLYATGRQQARLVRGRKTFVWRGRVLPIGIPLAAGAGAFVWNRRRSTRDALAIGLAVGALSYLEARAEWTVRRNAYRRRRDRD